MKTNKQINILAIDVGQKGGLAIKTKKGLETRPWKFTGLEELLNMVEPILTEQEIEFVIVGRPTRFPTVIARHSKMLAIIELLCQEYDIPYYETIDSEAKKEVLGKGNAKKPEIAEWGEKILPGKSEDEYDALMFLFFAQERCIIEV